MTEAASAREQSRPLARSGIDEGWEAPGHPWRAVPRDRLDALRSMLGPDHVPAALEDRGPLLVHGSHRSLDPGRPWLAELESGEELHGNGPLPVLPAGYHTLHWGDHSRRLAACPPRCDPPPRAAWGPALQLYAVRSVKSWGIGDLGDLRRLGSWAAGLGARVALVNPLHAARPGTPQQASPYTPSSRLWRNPLYMDMEAVAAITGEGEELTRLAACGRALDAGRRIDRDAVWLLKEPALSQAWDRWRHGAPGSEHRRFEAWRAQAGQDLERFAWFCVLAEQHPGPWRAWPEEMRRPDGSALAARMRAQAGRVGFHAWVQWLLDEQLRRAADALRPVLDLAVGVDAAGADAWLWQDCFVEDARVGAPPDTFNGDGQDWGLPPLRPSALRMHGFAPFLGALRSTLRHAAGVRIDHVMGLFRLWVIPPGGGPQDGAYVRYPWDELLDLVALESLRAGAFAVGEDLGTVEAGVREELARRRVLSTKVLWFEDEPPEQWPTASVGSISTHDLPTLAGLATGSDLRALQRIGGAVDVEAAESLRRRLYALAGPGAHGAGPSDDGAGCGGTGDGGAGAGAGAGARAGAGDDGAGAGEPTERVSVHAVAAAVLERLGRSSAAVVLVPMEDLLGVEERPNMPGTVDEWPNWRLALPVTMEQIASRSDVRGLAEHVARHRRPVERG